MQGFSPIHDTSEKCPGWLAQSRGTRYFAWENPNRAARMVTAYQADGLEPRRSLAKKNPRHGMPGA